jgi:hypothetical protein
VRAWGKVPKFKMANANCVEANEVKIYIFKI